MVYGLRPEIDSAIRFAIAGTRGGPSHQEAGPLRDPERIMIPNSFHDHSL